MNKIFIITAGNPAAQRHIKDTIENPIPAEKVEKHFVASELEEVKRLSGGGYYAWGAVPGPDNIKKWEVMEKGDHILVYQQRKYTYYAKVLFKARNKEFALENWGTDNEGNTWEYMYLLEKPVKFANPVPADNLAEYLPSSYRGFAKIKEERIERIARSFGSIDSFIAKNFPDISKGSIAHIPNFWWVCQGGTYDEERTKGILWAPNKDKRGGTPKHWANMSSVNPGDIIFNYANTAVRAISISKTRSMDSEKELDSDVWSNEGQKIDIDYYDIKPIHKDKIKQRLEGLKRALNGTDGPFDINGDVKQGYLFEFTYEAAKIIREIYGKPFPEEIEKYFNIEETSMVLVGNQVTNLLNTKKQIILYGPPGTGKTFSTKEITVKLLREENV